MFAHKIWPPSGQIYSHTAIARSAFGRPLDPLKYLTVYGTPTPYTFCTEGVENGEFCRIWRFQGVPTPKVFSILRISFNHLI